MEAVLTKQSRIAPRTAVAKPMSAAVAIGTGGAVRRRGPDHRHRRRDRLAARSGRAGVAVRAQDPARRAARRRACRPPSARRSPRSCSPSSCCCSSSRPARSCRCRRHRASPAACTPRCSAPDRCSRCRSHDYAGLGGLPAFVLLGLACGLLGVVITNGLFVVEGCYRRLPVRRVLAPDRSAPWASPPSVCSCRGRSASATTPSATCSTASSRSATVAVLGTVKLVSWWLALGSGTSGGTLAPILLISASFGTLAGTGPQPRVARARHLARRVRARGDGSHLRGVDPRDVHRDRVRVRADRATTRSCSR